MTCVRTHYIIDMVTSIIVSHSLHMLCEKLSYYVDVVLLKIGSTTELLASHGAGRRRDRKHYKPCHKCAWGNEYAGDFMSTDEKNWLKHVYKQSQLEKARDSSVVTVEIPCCSY